MKLKSNYWRLAAYFLAFLILTLVFLTIYAVGQQILRQSANDPQIQIAEDGAAYLSRAGSAADFDNPNKIDIAKSLMPFLTVYSWEGEPLASSGQLGSQLPLIPLSVLEASVARGENRVTWQPSSDLRIALVVRSVVGKNSGYIAVGRSLREIENRENNLFKIVGLAWLAGLALAFLSVRARELGEKNRNKFL